MENQKTGVPAKRPRSGSRRTGQEMAKEAPPEHPAARRPDSRARRLAGRRCRVGKKRST